MIDGAGRHVVDVRLERGRVHRHEQVGDVAGSEDVEVGEVDLERGDAGDGARGRRISAGKFGQRGEVVAEDGADVGDPVTDELHAVAGVAGEADHDPVEGFRASCGRGLCSHAVVTPPLAFGAGHR